MIRAKLAHLVACTMHTHGISRHCDDTAISEVLAEVTERSKAADNAACRLDRSPFRGWSRFCRMVRQDSILDPIPEKVGWA